MQLSRVDYFYGYRVRWRFDPWLPRQPFGASAMLSALIEGSMFITSFPRLGYLLPEVGLPSMIANRIDSTERGRLAAHARYEQNLAVALGTVWLALGLLGCSDAAPAGATATPSDQHAVGGEPPAADEANIGSLSLALDVGGVALQSGDLYDHRRSVRKEREHRRRAAARAFRASLVAFRSEPTMRSL